jgi:hypothetical protein
MQCLPWRHLLLSARRLKVIVRNHAAVDVFVLLQVETMGPVSYCGGGPPMSKNVAAAAAAAGVAAGGCSNTQESKKKA